jgi:hypothetical protein
MIAALYARKSTDQNVAAEAKFVMRQKAQGRGTCGGQVYDTA